MSFSPPPSPSRTSLFGHDVFYGELQSRYSLNGITLSHRIAVGSPEEVKVHTHLEAHFVLVTSGRYASSAKAIPNRRATLIYNPPGTTHRDHFEQGKGSFFTISVTTARLAESAEAELLPTAMHISDERACGLARTLLMECGRWDACSPLKAESLYSELLAAVFNRPLVANRARPSWLRAAYELIQDGYRENCGVGEIAKDFGLHPTHFARAFRAFVGCTPGDLLRARRLEKAAELLLKGNASLAEIALDCGFADQAQFTKAFSQIYGTTPGRYRRLSARPFRPARMLHFDKTADTPEEY
jgi:AraC family transcriptional regulator